MPGHAHRRRRDDPDVRRALAALDADAFDVYQPDVVLAAGMLRTRTVAELALARNRWFTPHTWTNGLGLLANLHVAAGVGGGPFLEFPYDPPGWTPERRDAFLAEPIRPDADGMLRVPARPGSRRRPRRGGDREVRRMTTTAPGPRPRHRRRVDRARPHRPAAEPRRSSTAGSCPRRRVETFDDVAGRDGSVITQVAEGGPEDVDRAVAAARASFDDRRWADQPRRPSASASSCGSPSAIRANRDELALLESLDVGKPIRDTLSVDVPSAAKTIQWYAETIDKVYGEVGPTGPDALSLVTREPIGVVAAIVPWNYPLIITAWKLGAALATGNSVVLKPASQSPLTALRLAELASEAGLPDGVLNVVPGPGRRRRRRRSRAIPASTRSRSRARPRSASRCCARSARPTSRRSRSSSAARARSSSSPTSATSRRPPRRSAGGSSTTAARPATPARGSSSIARVREELVERIADARAPARAGEPLDPTTRLGSIVDARQLDKVLGYVELGRQEGARVVAGGERVREDTGGYYIPPTILDGVDNDWRVAREEIFGPVLTVTEFEDEADGLRDRQRHAVRARRRALDARRQAGPPARARASGPASSGSTRSTPPTSRSRSAGSSSRVSGATRGSHALDGYTQLKTTWFDLSGD